MKTRKNNPYLLNYSVARFSLPLASAIVMMLSATPLFAGQIWDGTGADNNWSTVANWDSNTAPNYGNAITFAGGTRLSPNNNRAAASTVAGINFTNTATNAFTLTGNSLTLTGNITTTAATSALTDTISLPIILNATRTITTNTNHNLTIGSNITQSAASGLTKAGAATLTLSGSNSYAGTTTVSGGVLLLNSASALPSGGLNINGGIVGLGVDNFTRPQAATSNSANLNSVHFVSNGGFAAFGADRSVNIGGAGGTLGFGSGNVGGVIGTLNGKTLILGAGSSTHKLIWVNGLDVGSGTRTVQISDGLAAVDAEISGVIRGASGVGLNINGTGTLLLSNSNTISGDLTINGGTVIGAGSTNSPGIPVFGDRTSTRSIIINNAGTLRFNSGNILGSGFFSTTGTTLVINSGGTVTNGAPATNNSLNNIQINSGTLTATTGHPNYGAYNLNGTITSTGTSLISTSDAVNGRMMLTSTGANGVPTDSIIDVQSGSLTITAPLAEVTVDSKISGLYKIGAGDLILLATNTYSGPTTIDAGTLRLGNGSTTGSLTATSAIINNGNIIINRSNAFSQATDLAGAAISGSGSLTLLGSETKTLTVSNTYAGGTLLSAGTLFLSGAVNMPATGALQVNTGTTLSLADGAVSSTTSAGSLNLANGSRLVFDFNAGATDTITSLGAATANGTILIDINALSSPSGSGLTLISAPSGGLTSSGANYFLSNNSSFAGTITQSDTSVQIGSLVSLTPLTNAHWLGGQVSGALGAMALSSGTSNWASDGSGTSAGGLVPGPSSDVFFSATGATQQGNVVLGANMSVNSLTFNDTTPVIIGLDAFALTLNSTGTGSASAISANENATINANVALGAGQTWTVASAKSLDLNGVISGGFGLAKAGAGTLLLTGANTYSGGTAVNEGVLSFANGSLGTTGSISATGGTLQWNTFNTQDISSRLTMSNATTTALDTNGNNVTFASAIGGGTSGALTKIGSGVLTLSAANTYSGVTTISNGTLKLGNLSALGAGTGDADGTTISAGATLDLGGVGIPTANANAERITATGSGVDGNGAIISSSQIASPFNGVRFLTLAGDTTLGFANRWDIGHNAGAGPSSLVGAGYTLNILGTAAAAQVSLNNLGETDLGNININIGSTIATNIVYLQGSTTLGRPANTVTVTGGSTLNFFTNVTLSDYDKKFALNNGILKFDKTATTFTLPGTISLESTNTITANTTTVAVAASNQISGDGSLNKNGNGTLALTGPNIYTGNTTISAGGLIAGADSALGTIAGNTTVSANAALGFSGSINYSTAETIIGSGAGNSNAAGAFAVASRGFVQSVSGSNSFAGAIQINATGSSRIGTQTGASLALSGPITMFDTTTGVTVLFRVGDTDGDFVTLSNSGNSWDVATQIFTGNAGAGAGVRLGVNNALPIAIPVQTFAGTGAGTTLDLAGYNQELNGLTHTSNGILKISNSHASTTSVLTLNTTADRNFGTGGVILDGATAAIQLVKTGAFDQTLQGVNTYTGTTSVNAGSLTVSGAGTLSGTTGLTVANGATFNYLPTTIGTNLALGAGSTLALNDGSKIGLAWDATTSNRITAAGAATVGTGSGVTLALSGTPTLDTVYTVLSAASGLDVGSYSVLNTVDYTVTINKTATDVTITPTAATPLAAAYWKGGYAAGSGVWSLSNGLTTGGLSNWTTDAAGTVNTAQIPGAGTDVFFSATGAGAGDQNTMTLGANMSINSLTVNDVGSPNSNPVTLLSTGGHTLTLAAGSGTGLTVNEGSGAVTLGTDLILGAAQTWTNNSVNTVTASGNLTGAFALTKAGTGMVNIVGSTAVTATVVNAGTLYMGAQTGDSTTTTLGAGNPVTLNGTSNLTIRRTNTGVSDVIGAIDGTGSLTLLGDNAATIQASDFPLNNASTYEGGTTVIGARAIASLATSFGTGPVTIGTSAGVFMGVAGLIIENDFTIAGQGWNENAGFLGALRLNNNTTLNGDITLSANARICSNGTSLIAGNITGGFALDFFEDTSFGTITLTGNNTYTGETIVNSMGAGTSNPSLVVGSNTALGTTAAGTTVFGTGTTNNGSQLVLSDGITVTDETLTLDPTISGYRSSLITAANAIATWDGNVVLAGTGGVVGFNANGATSNLTVGLTSADTITGTNNLTLRGLGTGSVNSAVNIGEASILKTDAGIWVIASNNNDFTGTPSIAGGVLSVSTIANSGINSALGAGNAISLGQNSTAIGTLQFTGASGGSSDRALTLNNGTNGAAGIENTVAGQTLTLSGDLTVTTPGSACSFTLMGEGNGLYSGTILGSPLLSLIKSGTGTWDLSGANAYTGNTTVNGGTLRINNSYDVVGNGTTSQLIIGSGIGTNGALIVGSGAGTVTFGGNGYANAVQVGINGGTGALTINGGTVNLAGTTGTAASLHIGVQVATAEGTGTVTINNGTLNVGQRILMGANNLLSSGILTVTGGIVNVGYNGTLGYTGNNPGVIIFGTGSSTVNLDGGTVNLFGFKAHSAGTANIVFNGGTLVALGSPSFFLGNNGHTDAAPTGVGTYNTVVKSGGAIIDTNGFDITIPSGLVFDPLSTGGGLTKNNAGTLTLTGANTYSGATSVANGTLALVGGSQASPITVSPGASLGFTLESPTTSTSTFNLTAGTIKITGTPTLNSYDLITTSAGITGTPVLDAPIAGYDLKVEGNSLKLVKAGYAAWAAINAIGSTPGQDKDGDGVSNAVEYVLGGDVNTNDISKLPQGTISGTNMVFTFLRDVDTIDGSTVVTIEVDTDLSGWETSYAVPDIAAANNPGVTVVKNTPSGFDTITLTVPMGTDPKKFGRLKVVVPD